MNAYQLSTETDHVCVCVFKLLYLICGKIQNHKKVELHFKPFIKVTTTVVENIAA